MIFVTVGTDLPFDRMVRVIDHWAAENSRSDIFAQIGDGGWEPQHIPFRNFLQPPEFREMFEAADLIISHAGMGTILSALHYGKPILVMPKRASLGEHRNEHQSATARHMMALAGVNVAFGEDELRCRLDHLETLDVPACIGATAGMGLTSALRDFIHDDHRTRRPSIISAIKSAIVPRSNRRL
jgi:UDP-N-acetylglucosamine transferase subunit ALG13